MLRQVFWLSSDNLIEQILVGMVFEVQLNVSTRRHLRQDAFEQRRHRAKLPARESRTSQSGSNFFHPAA